MSKPLVRAFAWPRPSTVARASCSPPVRGHSATSTSRLDRVTSAALSFESPKKALADTKLRALFDGVIARKLVTDFRTVAAGEPVLLLQDESLMEVVVDVPERDLAGNRRDI